jgi:hypothetical protein
MFGHLLGPKSFDSPERPLAYKQAYLPMTFGGIGLIPIATITPIAYLGNWALIISIIVVTFVVD